MAFCCVLTVQVHLFKLELKGPLETGPVALQDQRAVMGNLPTQEWEEDTSEKQLLASPCIGKSKLQVLGCSVSRVQLFNILYSTDDG